MHFLLLIVNIEFFYSIHVALTVTIFVAIGTLYLQRPFLGRRFKRITALMHALKR